MEAACTVLDVDKEAREHFEAVLAMESQAIADSIPCSTTGGPLKDDAILADTYSTDGLAMAVDLLTAPDCLLLNTGEPLDTRATTV